jgi:hypothetical protein
MYLPISFALGIISPPLMLVMKGHEFMIENSEYFSRSDFSPFRRKGGISDLPRTLVFTIQQDRYHFFKMEMLSGHPQGSDKVVRSRGSLRNCFCGFLKDPKARPEPGNGGFAFLKNVGWK